MHHPNGGWFTYLRWSAWLNMWPFIRMHWSNWRPMKLVNFVWVVVLTQFFFWCSSRFFGGNDPIWRIFFYIGLKPRTSCQLWEVWSDFRIFFLGWKHGQLGSCMNVGRCVYLYFLYTLFYISYTYTYTCWLKLNVWHRRRHTFIYWYVYW